MDDATPCSLCGAPPPEPGETRCPNCGLHPAGDLGRRAVPQLAVGLAGIYFLTALVVLLTRTR